MSQSGNGEVGRQMQASTVCSMKELNGSAPTPANPYSHQDEQPTIQSSERRSQEMELNRDE